MSRCYESSRKYPRRYFRCAALPALLAGRARNALGVGDGPPAEPRPARRADHLRAEGPPEERAGRVHPRRRAARPGARREALPRARARDHGHRDTPPLRAVLRALRAARRRLAGIPGLSAKPLDSLDALIAEIEAAVTSTHRIARLTGLPRLRAARA